MMEKKKVTLSTEERVRVLADHARHLDKMADMVGPGSTEYTSYREGAQWIRGLLFGTPKGR